jgi:hypothetical protein
MKIRIYQSLEVLFKFIAEHAEKARQHFAICPDCGKNRYTGEGCIVH